MITFITAYKNLLITRKEITLDFLEYMDNKIKEHPKCESIISDYDSDDDIKEIIESYPHLTYLRTPANPGQWLNIPKCFNNGVFNAKGEIVGTLGPDMRFDEELIDITISVFKRMGEIILRPICGQLDEYDKVKRYTYSPYFLLKKTFLKSRGFDERMSGWGKEEDDLLERVFNKQKLLEFQMRGVGYIHIWHDRSWADSHDFGGNKNTEFAFENIRTEGRTVLNSYW